MSDFFESEETNNDNILEEGNKEVVVEDYTGLINITLESEMAWYNIEKTIMKEEYSAILKEDEGKMKDSAKAYFQKISEFFTKLWETFSNTIKNIVTRLSSRFVDGEKFLQKNQGKLSNYKNDKKTKVRDWSSGYTIDKLMADFSLQSVDSKIKSIINSAGDKELSTDDIVKELGFSSLSSIDSDIVKKARKSENQVEILVDRNALNTAVSDIKKAKSALDGIKIISKASQSLINQGKKEANEGANATDLVVQKTKKVRVNNAKNGVSVVNKISNVFTKLVMEKYSDSVKILKTAMSSSSSEKDTNSNNSTELAPVKKEDFTLTIEDFDFEEKE